MSFKGKYCEICLEPCFNGCDVAVYDLNQNLLEPKFFTNLNLPELSQIEQIINVRKLAIDKATEFYNKYEQPPIKEWKD